MKVKKEVIVKVKKNMKDEEGEKSENHKSDYVQMKWRKKSWKKW